jgi:hypothetical protein
MYLYLYLVSLGARLKRRVVRSVKNSLEVREFLGIEFLKVPNYSYSSLRLLVWHVVEALKEVGQPKDY